MPAVSAQPEDTGSSFPDGKRGNSLTNRREKFLARLICLLYCLTTQCLTTSHQRMFLKTIRISVILMKAVIENFLHHPYLVCDDSISHVDEDIAQYFNKCRFKVLTNDQFNKVKETFLKPKIGFLGQPSVNDATMVLKSVRNNTGLC